MKAPSSSNEMPRARYEASEAASGASGRAGMPRSGQATSTRTVGHGAEVLLFYQRPIAIWIAAVCRVYLLFGWDAFQSTVRAVREFACAKTGLQMQKADDLRRALRIGDKVLDCSCLHGASENELSVLWSIQHGCNGIAGRHSPELAVEHAPVGADGGRRYVSLTKLLEEWFGDLDDPRADELMRPGFNAAAANKLLQREGFLDSENLPTERAARIGVKTAHWQKGDGTEALYALYPRRNFDMYRDLIYTLVMQGSGELSERSGQIQIAKEAKVLDNSKKNFIIKEESTRDD